jgi:flagellar hook assembly protein FlgD
MSITIFNSAGEKVRSVVSIGISTAVSNVILSVNKNVGSVFNPMTQKLDFNFPNLQSPGQVGGDMISVFSWDGKNDNGQVIGNGEYYAKISVTNQYGIEETIMKEVQIIQSADYVRVSIYNSAGELVQTIEQPKGTTAPISLGMNDVTVLGKDGGKISVNYAPGLSIAWDGRNAQGRLVDSGLYEVRVEDKAEGSYVVEASKTITIINQTGVILGEIKVLPNPVRLDDSTPKMVKITWSGRDNGSVSLKIYNKAGELIREIGSKLMDGHAIWNLDTNAGSPVSGGLYICILDAKKDSGENEKKTTKIAVIFNSTPGN